MTAKINAIQRFSRSQNTKTRAVAYNAFMRPHISYCLPVWGNASKEICDRMDRALLKCARTVIGDPKATITRSVIDVLNIFNFADLVFLHDVLASFKCIKSTESVNNTYFTFLSDISFYSTRNASNFK